MTKSQVRALLVIIGITVLVYVSGGTAQTPTKPATVVRVVEQPKSNFKELNQDEMINFVSSTLEGALRDYPVQSVRQKLQDASAKGRDHGMKILVSEKVRGNVAMGAYWFEDKPYMTIYIGQINKMRKLYEHHPDMLTDEIVAAALHEFYHLFQQDWIDWEHDVPRETKMRMESEAWWYVAEEVHWPMIRGGRLSADPSNWSGAIGKPILAHRESGGDPNHPAWKAFIETVTPR